MNIENITSNNFNLDGNGKDMQIEVYEQLIEQLQQENRKLKKQLEYLRNGEYYNQLRFENKMLQDIVDNGEVSKEDREFIDCTHRNTELLEQQEEFINYMMNTIENITKDETDDEEIKRYLIQRGNTYKEIFSKYKEIGSVIKVCSGSQDIYNYEK